MSSGMPELGSKISLISKADIRYEGRLFTVDPQECTIALASVRSFGTEDRETQYPVAPQSQVYDYILFRGSDIKDIRVLNNVPSLPNDPAIMQMSVPPSLGGGSGAPAQFGGQFSHPVVGGQPQYPQYHPMAGFPGAGVHAQLGKTTGSMLDLLGGGSQQNQSRSGTPSLGGHRKSPTADQGTQQIMSLHNLLGHQVGPGAGGSGQQRDSRRPSNPQQKQGGQQPQHNQQRNRTNSRNRRYPSGGNSGGPGPHNAQQAGPPQQPHHQQTMHQQNQQNQHNQQHPGTGFYDNTGGYGRGGWRGRSRGRGRGFVPRGSNKNTLKFENDYDFEQANTEFEELRSQLAKAKISDEVKPEVSAGPEVEKKDDSGNETAAGDHELDDEGYPSYDKTKSFFDNISCEAVERSKGRSQRTDWRTERKLNSETFGVASARRGAWRGRGGWRQNPHHQQMNSFSWRPQRGGAHLRGRPGPPQQFNQHQPRPRRDNPQPAQQQQPQQQAVTAK